MAGKFISVEGCDGCGKSTQARLLYEALHKAGIPVLLTREPGGTKGGEDIRDLVVKGETGRWDKLTETLLYIAARRDHVEKVIKPTLERGTWVISDRFFDSTFAYQGYGHGVQIELIAGLHKLALGDFKPDLTFIYDIDIAKSMHRAGERNDTVDEAEKEDRYERMGAFFQKQVRIGFIEVAKKNLDRCLLIPADDTIKNIHIKTIELLDSRLRANVSMLGDSDIDKVLSDD